MWGSDSSKCIKYLLSSFQDTLKFIESKQAEIQENRSKIIGKRESMLKKQTEFETDFETARMKAESEAANAERLSPRILVTK